MCPPLRGLVLFGRYSYTSARPGLVHHKHHGCIEICHLIKGRQTYTVGMRDYRLCGATFL